MNCVAFRTNFVVVYKEAKTTGFLSSREAIVVPFVRRWFCLVQGWGDAGNCLLSLQTPGFTEMLQLTVSTAPLTRAAQSTVAAVVVSGQTLQLQGSRSGVLTIERLHLCLHNVTLSVDNFQSSMQHLS